MHQQLFLSCTATRLIMIIESDNKNIGDVIFIPISMAEVSTCNPIVKVGDRV